MIRVEAFRPEHMVELAGWPEDRALLLAHTAALSVMDDDTVIGCGGIGIREDGIGEAWAAVGAGHGVTLARAARSMMPVMARGLGRIEAGVACGNERAARFAAWLGFAPTGETRDGFVRYARDS